MKRFVGPLLILLCTLIWGTAFVAQKTGSEHYGPFALTCFRNLLASVFLAGVIWTKNRIQHRTFRADGAVALGGALAGIVLFSAMASQQIGIESTSPGVSAFITANYILIVPFLAWMFGRGRPRLAIWLGVALALFGTYLICCRSAAGGAGGTMGKGELWTVLCALLFAVHIMVVDRFAKRVDVLVFSMVQFFAAGLCAAPFMLLPSEASRLTFDHLLAGWFSLFYVGILSSGIAYTLQNLGQARTSPSLAALVMSFESVVGAVSGYLFLGDVLATAQVVGCVLVFTAIAFTSWVDAR